MPVTICQFDFLLLEESYCVDGWDKAGNSCFKIFDNGTVNFEDAKEQCALQAGTPSTPYLAVPNNDEELNLLTSNRIYSWLGIYRTQTNASFIDINTEYEMLFNGVPLPDGGYPWLSGYGNSPDYDCVAIFYTIDGSSGFYDDACFERYDYACEYNP